jgi:hypothetical protein
MKLDTKVLARLDELVEKGNRVLSTSHDAYPSNVLIANRHHVNPLEAHKWGMSCQNLLERVFGRDSLFQTEFARRFREFPKSRYVTEAHGIVLSARDEYQQGFLFETRTLIEAEVFEDFLEQAEFLLRAGYIGASAVIVGCVLEDGLRKRHNRVGLPPPEKPKLDLMNADLAKEGVYNKLVQKQITALADLRNKAAHGQWDQFSDADVTNMLSQVRSILVNHLS